jgi:imidazolonepropionase-like amidohydrolase
MPCQRFSPTCQPDHRVLQVDEIIVGIGRQVAAAAVFRLLKKIGTGDPDKRADLLIVAGGPLSRIPVRQHPDRNNLLPL